jgi:hypothetical protein
MATLPMFPSRHTVPWASYLTPLLSTRLVQPSAFDHDDNVTLVKGRWTLKEGTAGQTPSQRRSSMLVSLLVSNEIVPGRNYGTDLKLAPRDI